MKTEYVWNYDIKVKDENGEYVYERETLEHLLEILKQLCNYFLNRLKDLQELKGDSSNE